MKIYCFGVHLLFALLFFRECSAPSDNTNLPVANAPIVNAESVSVCSDKEIDYRSATYRDASWMKETWKKFAADGRYCVPDSRQFRIPEAAKKDSASRSDLEGTVKHPYGWGDFNDDILNQDFVAMVIDKSQDYPNNFALVIFHEPRDGKTIPNPQWVFKDKDLSKSIMTGGSGMFIIDTYADDGSSKGCYVNWNAKKKAYSCDAKYNPAVPPADSKIN